MRSAVVLVAGLLCLGVGSEARSSSEGDDDLLKFETMVGVSGPFRGPTNAIRGVPGAGAAWRLSRAEGKLGADGKLEIDVRGLVLVATGTNPVGNFRGLVSCQSIDGTGAPSIVNVSTDDFAASPAGDAEIEAEVELPTPCIAPIVFVTNSAGRWFSVTGR